MIKISKINGDIITNNGKITRSSKKNDILSIGFRFDGNDNYTKESLYKSSIIDDSYNGSDSRGIFCIVRFQNEKISTVEFWLDSGISSWNEWTEQCLINEFKVYSRVAIDNNLSVPKCFRSQNSDEANSEDIFDWGKFYIFENQSGGFMSMALNYY